MMRMSRDRLRSRLASWLRFGLLRVRVSNAIMSCVKITDALEPRPLRLGLVLFGFG